MIPYEELVAALDRYVARNGGTPQSAHVPASALSVPAPSQYEPPTNEVRLPSARFDEPHDPDLPALGSQGGEDSTHVGGLPPPPLSPISDEHSNEIDLGEILSDDEL